MKKLNLINLIFLIIFLSETAIGLDVKFFKERLLTGKTLVGLVKDKNKEISSVKGNFMSGEIDFYSVEDGSYYCVKGINIYTKSLEYPFLLNVQYKNGVKERIEYKIMVEGRKMENADEIKITEKNMKDVTKENSAKENIYVSNIVRKKTNKRLWIDNFLMPVKGVITSPFDGLRSINNGAKYFHQGLDIASPEGTKVNAPNCGAVVLTEKLISRGNTVIINHGQGIFSVYYHLSKIEVKEKDFLQKGDLIGFVGSTGISTGPHLHWSIFANGVAVDPEDWLNGNIEKFIFDKEDSGRSQEQSRK